MIDYFFKEFVYRNLYYYEGKQKKELCDGLIVFQDSYVVFQIKEKDNSTALDWLDKKVYKKAVSQIKDSIKMIRSGNPINVESYNGEQIQIDPEKNIIPVIVFDSDDLDYRQIHTSTAEEGLKINVFSMQDFEMVLNNLVVPYDIVLYLNMRKAFFDNRLPDFFINEVSESVTTLARIENELGLLDYFKAMTNKNKYISPEALRGYRFIIKHFEERLIEKDIYSPKEYREIVRDLFLMNRNTVQDFMLRWDVCVEHCQKNEETVQHFIVDGLNDVGYLFLTQNSLSKSPDYIRFVTDVFKYKFNVTTAISVVFDMLDNEEYSVEWMYMSGDNVYDKQIEKLIREENLWGNAKKLDTY